MIPKSIGSIINSPDKDGIIFDIQKFSVHDGPGIRTIVFLKGCTLGCAWCSNPESQSKGLELMWREHLCTHCRKCEYICPYKAISESFNSQKVIDKKLCLKCGICEEGCHTGALQLIGRYVSVTEVMDEVEKDKAFYETSGGGITLGGGEPLAQAEFALKLLKESKARGISTAIETAGCVPWESFEQAAEYTDLFLYDVKSMNSEIHKNYIGTCNELVIKNLQKLKDLNAHIILRMPVIPGVNDSEENIRSFAQLAGILKVDGIELLPFHNLSTAKYKGLDRDYPMNGTEPPSKENMRELKKFAKDIFTAGKNQLINN